MKIVYVTRGDYQGRYMRLEDDVAAAALSDGWARESESPTEEEVRKAHRDYEKRLKEGAYGESGELPEQDEDPQSLIDWEDSIGQEPEIEGEEGRRAGKVRRRRGHSS